MGILPDDEAALANFERGLREMELIEAGAAARDWELAELAAAAPRRRKRKIPRMNGRRPLVDEATVAAWLDTTEGTLRNARCSGRGALAGLPFHRIGRAVRYDPADVEEFLQRRRYGPNGGKSFAADVQHLQQDDG